jgi:hypothetical protein
VSAAELHARWPEFVAEVRKERISLASVLEETEPLGTAEGSIRIGCSNDFQLSSITRHKELLADIAFRIFHVRHRIRAEQHDPTASGPGQAGSPNDHPPEPEEHPMLKIVRKELGAEPL